MIRHHPSEATLTAYAAGTLPEALALVAATHVAGCAACQDRAAIMERAGGVLLGDLDPAPMAMDALNRVLERTVMPEPEPPPVLHAELPAPLNRAQMGRWWPVLPGVRFRPLRRTGSAWGGLLLAQPGRGLLKHGHTGLELTTILRGSFADGSAEYFAGDLAEPEADHDAPPVVTSAEPCLCVIASEGMRLRGLLGFAQRLLA
jgi:putative transcriptional regulator